MSVKKEPGRRWIEVETTVPGTPEEVWRAIATGPGVSSWFLPCEVDEEVGGEIRLSMGAEMNTIGTVTRWEPPQVFRGEGRPYGEAGPATATEWTVEALEGGTCRVRMVQSLFTDAEDWDAELENTEKGWPGAFAVLRLYLQHFAGKPCSVVLIMHPTSAPVAEAWNTVAGALGLQEGTATGPWQGPDGDTPALGGRLETLEIGEKPRALIRLEQPTGGIAFLHAFAWGPTTLYQLILYFYGDEASAVTSRDDPLWRQWLAARLPPPPMPPSS